MYNALIIGTSAGGIDALKKVLETIEKPLLVPIIVIQHLSPKHQSYLPNILSDFLAVDVKEIDSNETIKRGMIYIAPSNYHVLIEKELKFTLTVENRVAYARPSIDVSFESAADAYGDQLIGVILTGANTDGSNGIKAVHDAGGYCIVQNPEEAYASEMPRGAIDKIRPDDILDLTDIGLKINDLLRSKKNGSD